MLIYNKIIRFLSDIYYSVHTSLRVHSNAAVLSVMINVYIKSLFLSRILSKYLFLHVYCFLNHVI